MVPSWNSRLPVVGDLPASTSPVPAASRARAATMVYRTYGLASVGAGDVLLHRCHLLAKLGHHRLHAVADRDHTHQLRLDDLAVGPRAKVDDGDVAEALLGHELHGGVDGRVGLDGHQLVAPRHDVPHLGVLRGAPQHDDLVQVVTLGHDAAELVAAVHDHQRAHVQAGHLAHRLEHGVVLLDAQRLLAAERRVLLLDEVTDGRIGGA